MYRKILIATDGSELSEKAVDSGLALAALCKASVVVLKVVQRYPRSYMEGSQVLSIQDVQKVEDSWAAQAQTILDAIKAKGQAQNLTVHTEVVHSDLVAETLVSAAKRLECDLIVMASHGHKGLQRLLLGSETQHVLTHTHIPVLVLR